MTDVFFDRSHQVMGKHRQTEVASTETIAQGKLSRKMRMAARFGDVRKVRKIIAKFGLSHCKDWRDGFALLREALRSSQLDVMKVLLEAGAKLEDTRKRTYILHEAVSRDVRYMPFVKLLLENGASVNSRNRDGNSPLDCAQRYEMAELLCSGSNSRVDVNAVNSRGLTPLHQAAWAYRSRLVQVLIDMGADVNFRAPEAFYHSFTPLHAAVLASSPEAASTCKALLEGGANVNARDVFRETPLHVAVLRRPVLPDTLEALLNWPEVDMEAKDVRGNTALSEAVARLQFVAVSTLLEYGADINIANRSGLTPVQVIEDIRAKGSYKAYAFSRILRVSMALRNHIAKLKCAALPVIEENLIACQCTTYEVENGSNYRGRYTSKTLDDPKFVKLCTDEVLRMKNETIGNSRMSYYDILSLSSHQVAMYRYSRNVWVSGVVESTESVMEKFPVYGRWIAVRFRRATWRMQLKERVVASLQPIFDVLPNLCIDLITDFLSNEDLEFFIRHDKVL